MYTVKSLGLGDSGAGLDTTDTESGGEFDSDVTLLTPAGAPGVSDNVVVSTVTNSGDGVSGVGSALGGVHDTAGVVLEDGLVGTDGDGDGLLVEGRLEGGGG